MADEIQIEEILEYIWILEENSDKAESSLVSNKFGNDIANTYLKVMAEQQLINLHNSVITYLIITSISKVIMTIFNKKRRRTGKRS